jgi:hypothetical protein
MRLSLAACAAFALVACGGETIEERVEETPIELPAPREGSAPDRFARLALSCIHKEYPNKISHVMQSEADVRPPHELTPAFYGCFDWHSAVHGHWLLVRILKTEPETPYHDAIIEGLSRSFTRENMEAEVAYYTGADRRSFERPYGIAWFLQLVAELEESEEPVLLEWRERLRPLERAIVAQVEDWLPKLAYPIRLGTHNQTAFAFGLMLDYARTVDDRALEGLLVEKILDFHADDVNCPLSYEPSGEDFLSPCLMEADLMRRVMGAEAFADWLSDFLPQIPRDGSGDWLAPGIVEDPTDGKLVHLDGVNLSRAWALEGIAAALPAGDPRIGSLMASAALHRETGIAAVSDTHYSGSHWLGSFATYLVTQRGITGAGAPQ